MDRNEKEAVISLFKFFKEDRDWHIVDIGVNKGTWSDIFIEYRNSGQYPHRYQIHVFEPNDMLLNYLKVKWDYVPNIHYNSNAVFSESGVEMDFFYFEDFHNGISSVYDNPSYDQFDKKKKKIKTIAVDDYWDAECNIDFLKIDVEGADHDVLIGCRNLLRNRKIKFIQVEYSEHWKLGSHTLSKTLDFLLQFGYNAWEFDGSCFVKLKKESLIEDYGPQNLILTYKDISPNSRDYIDLNYTQDWNGEFKKSSGIVKASKLPIRLALEIGSFEGLTSNYICDHLLARNYFNPKQNRSYDGRLICVDPLTDEYLPQADKQTNDMFIGQYERFINNTKDQPIELVRKKSREAESYLSQFMFDLCYIDGDHTEEQVFLDGEFCLSKLRYNGFIIFDDYEWSEETKKGIDRFLFKNIDEIEILRQEYQVVIRKK